MRLFRLVGFSALFLVSALPLAAGESPARSTLEVRSDFPGGSAQVGTIDQARRAIHVQPADHPDRGWRCWWYFKVTGIEPGETITVEVTGDGFTLPDRAAVSLDDRTWTQTAPGRRGDRTMTWTHRVDAREAYFAWGPPYLPSHTADLVARSTKACPAAVAFDLCRTPEGRPVRGLRVSEADEADCGRRGVWIQARQHAWESGSSWVCDGLTDWLVSADPRAAALRRRALVVVVPILDVDNVVRGAGGKNERPQDHNRDWSDSPHWPAVRAAMAEVRRMDAGRQFALFVDLHNPGAADKTPNFYTSPADLQTGLQRLALERFLKAAKAEVTGPLAFTGKVTESGPKYDKDWERIAKNWVYRNTNDRVVAVSLETPWNTPHSTVDGYRRMGQEMGLAIERFLRAE